MNLPPDTPEERNARRRVIFFRVALIVSWFMLALGFGVIIYRLLEK